MTRVREAPDAPSRPPMRSGVRFALTTAAIVAATAAAMLTLTDHWVRQHALEEARADAVQLLERNLAIHAYLNQELKPRVFALREAAGVPTGHFDPVWMSSTYAVREIDRQYRASTSGGRYYYKECAVDARSPENEADPFERAFLADLNADPELDEYAGVRQIEGRPYLVLLRRGEVMEEACLRCHSDPAAAPADLVTRYGPERSFGRRVGEVVSAVSIRVPLSTAFARARSLSYRLATFTVLALVGLFLAQVGLVRRLLLRPLERFREQVAGIDADPTRLGEPVAVSGGPELRELARAFDALADSLRRSRAGLEEQVAERTAALEEANRELRSDVRRRRRVEGELTEARRAAEQANRAKSAFLANMSHEIRTPLNGLMGMIGLVLDAPLPETEREYLRIAQSSADSLLEILDGVLDLSKVEAGRLELEEVPFALRDTLEGAVETFAARAQGKGLELLLRLAPDVPEGLRGDPGRLRQVLVNLIGNAVKFTPVGEVFVEVVRAPGFDPTAPVLRFSVRDTGVGLPEDFRERLFEPFSQADVSTTRQYGGSGLGLAISRRLVAAFGGEIGVDGRDGGGSTFWFTARFRPAAAAPVDPASPLAPFRALLVDGHRTHRRILRELLEPWGGTVDEATDRAEGLARLTDAARAGHPYDLVVLDRDPSAGDRGASGSAPPWRPVPGPAAPKVVVLAAAGVPPPDPGRSDAAHADACLLKPVRRAALRATVADLLGGSRAARAVRERDASAAPPGVATAPTAPHILLAEDNPVNQILARALLEKKGCRVTTVGDGDTAVQAWAAGRFDLVLMDVQMPVADGLSATAAIRAREEATGRPRTPVVALTAFALDGDRERCRRAGMDDYLAKPLQRAELYAALERWTGAGA